MAHQFWAPDSGRIRVFLLLFYQDRVSQPVWAIPAGPTRDFGSAPTGSALPDATAGSPACIGALSFLGAAALLGVMVAEERKILEEMRSGKKEAFGGSVQRSNG